MRDSTVITDAIVKAQEVKKPNVVWRRVKALCILVAAIPSRTAAKFGIRVGAREVVKSKQPPASHRKGCLSGRGTSCEL